MSAKETGGPAFPMQDQQSIHAYAAAAIEGISDNRERDSTYILARAQAIGGMTLRDYFAAKAMQSFLTNQPPHVTDMTYAEWASDSYQMADAMLKARVSTAAGCAKAGQMRSASKSR